MNKFDFVRGGVTQLPPGFRFQPTDEELLFQYLKCKVFSLPLPASIIPQANVYKFDPWDLPGDSEQERYFFSNKEAKYRNGNRTNRATPSGHWKATGLDKQIVSSSTKNQTVLLGMRKTLVFHRGKPPHGSRTDWIMHEYRLVSPACNSPQTNNPIQKKNCFTQMGDWVICHIFLKKRSLKNDDDDEDDDDIIKTNSEKKYIVKDAAATQPRKFFNFMMSSSSSSSCASSSCSSVITEVTSSGPELSDHEENNSSCKCTSNFY